MIKRFVAFFDARDLFCLVGFGLLYAGIAGRFGHEIAMIVTGAIILLKGLTKWV